MIPERFSKKLKEIFKGENETDLLFALPFNLEADTNKRCDGFVALDKENLFVTENGKIVRILPISDMDSLLCELGVGCLFVSYKDKNENVFLLARADLVSSKFIQKTVRSINSYIEDGTLKDASGHSADRCEKCGRPFRSGSDICLHCSDKKKVLSRVWELFSPYKLYVFIAVVMFFVISGASLLLPYINRIAIDEYITKDIKTVSITAFVLVLLSMLALEFAIRGLSVLRSHILIVASNRMIVDLRDRLFEKIQRLSVNKISQRTAGDIMRRVTHDTSQVDSFLVNYLPSVLEQLVIFIAVGAFLLIYDPLLFLLVMIPTPIVVMSFNFFWKFMRGLFRKRWTAGSKTNTVLHDIFSGIRVVKAFGMEHRESMRFEAATAEEKKMQIKTDCIWSVLMPIIRFFVCFGEFIILFYVGNKIIGGQMTLGEMTQFSSYASMLYAPLRMIANIPRHLMHFMTSSSKIFEILDENEEVTDSEKAKVIDIHGDIRVKDVSFGYDGGKEVLHKINIDINQGDFVGIVGASGVGKSTLINLIMRMYDVEEGSIEIDGVDIREISQESLRSQMGVVLQETFLFSGTVYQNIAYAKPSASREEVIAVSKLAGCHNFIARLPDGYNTKVGEKGSTLSGGERQRVAIARALLHNPKILILDEATASLDTETEKQIQDALARLSSKRTTIAIAHRLSTLRNATKLVVLDKGRVVQTGTHDELMQDTDGIYYSLVMAQREMSEM